jgi:hypothetical protein
MDAPVPAAKLAELATPNLIKQYDVAVLKRGFAPQYNAETGRPTRISQRIHRIVDMLVTRADGNDVTALAWFEEVHA